MLHTLCKDPRNTTVLVAMSGGVDSSVAAALLKKSGYSVIGVTLHLHEDSNNAYNKKSCCGSRDIQDARQVAVQMDFPHYVINYESVFKKEVIDRFVDDYANGITPIPCLRCNQSVKFRDLIAFAHEIGADAMVTGHYVRRLNGVDMTLAQLHMAIDRCKDQTYFLFSITQEQLNFSHFPLGDKTKVEVRQIASDLGLKIYSKPDSQDICFIPNRDHAGMINRLRPDISKVGNIVHINTGAVLGQHTGLVNYTIGQRRGIAIAYGCPLYVIKVDIESNVLFVGEEDLLYSTEIIIGELNLFTSDLTKNGFIKAEVCIRALQAFLPACITLNNDGTAVVKLLQRGRAVTRGQACVIYDGTQVLGGGIIL